MKQRYGGDFTKFDKIKNLCIQDGNSFKIVHSGQSKKIQLNNKAVELRYTADRVSSKLKGVHLCRMVTKDIDNFIEAGNTLPYTDRHYNLNRYILPNIERKILSSNQRWASVDMSACYFTTAHKLGWLSQNTYKQIIINPEYKAGAVAAIGALNKREFTEIYDEGVLVHKDWNREHYYKYSPFFWQVLDAVYEIMIKCAKKFHDKMYMWLTDCAFVDEDIVEEVQNFFRDNAYRCKTKRGRLISLDENEYVTWRMDGEVEKCMKIYRSGFEEDFSPVKAIKNKMYEEGNGEFIKRVSESISNSKK